MPSPKVMSQRLIYSTLQELSRISALMRKATTEVNDRVRIRRFLSLGIVHHPVVAPLVVVRPSIVGTVSNQRVLLTILVRRAIAIEGELGVCIRMRKAAIWEQRRFLATAEVLTFQDFAPLDGAVDIVVREGRASAGHRCGLGEIVYVDWSHTGVVWLRSESPCLERARGRSWQGQRSGAEG